ncbi:sulfate ABC transporter permease subunit CysT [Actinomadura sp. DC4]|uniref:sulfate ABC transporter permease subunit CysT n=1 Tax=Actinomadura sp. DC4 TaxID=3055069 RepID=UPI0025B005B2|nr:sulfate ABC transporter permease subunit CysT [Actinomadura sp. DC4]MDN3352525.1 sulfate ABC transporter permease subunit CysT [Actinomadura sp. DC4]
MTSEILDTDSAGPGTAPGPARPVTRRRRPSAPTALGLGSAMIFLSLIVLIPLAAVLWKSAGEGPGFFWKSVTTPDAWAALKLTIVVSVIVALINLVMGTLIAWVLVRDSFPGKAVLDTLIDLPFALPTIVAGLVLLELYGSDSPLGVSLAYTRAGVAVALLFVTLPFVVRTVQPVLMELDRDMEQAAASLGAGNGTIFRRIILPNLVPAMVSGTALAFTRSIAEFGSTVLISGNLPFKTQVAAVQIFGQIENDNTASAAAVSTVLLAVAFVVLVALDLVQRWGSRRG